jgi:hypothetical protein
LYQQVILILIVGVVLELNLNGVPVVVRGEPRPAILAFLVATLWELVHIEWMVLFHHRAVASKTTAAAAATTAVSNRGNLAHAIRFRGFGTAIVTSTTSTSSVKHFRKPLLQQCFLAGLLLITLSLFAVGSSLDLVRFQTTLVGGDDDEVIGCVRAYNLLTFPTIAVSDLVLDRNECRYGIWILVVSYMVLVLVMPCLVHVVHALAFWFGLRSQRVLLFRVTETCWTGSCVEVFLIALFVIEVRTLIDDLPCFFLAALQ